MGGLVWLASYPKSGNTWTRSFLHNLLRANDDSHSINRMATLTTWDSSVRWYQGLLEKPLVACSKDEVAAVRPQANRTIAEGTEGLVFVKTHNALVRDRGTPTIDSSVTAGVIYIVRNPLDVAISYRHHLTSPLDKTIARLNTAGLQTKNSRSMAYELHGSWSEHVDSWTRRPMKELFIMRYEDMQEEPLRTFGKLAEFLLLTPTRKQLACAIQASSFEKLKEQEDEEGFFEKPKSAERFFREGRTGQWRDQLTKDQIEAIVRVNREQMVRFGYVPETAST